MGILDTMPPEEELELTVPEQQLPDIHMEQLITELESKPKKSKAIPVMVLIALICGAVLAGLVYLARPYFTPAAVEEDPAALREYHSQNFEPLQVTERPESPEDPEETTEPTIATIPPDPNIYGPHDFQYGRHNYLHLQNGESYAGVDVSAYQGDIEWSKVKASGIDFAMIRLGYRGYESGKLVEDVNAEANLTGAREAGLKIGAYFFSQALTVQEVDQEIEFMLEILGERYLDMPIVLDWEIPAASARTANMDARTLTDLQRHFCKIMKDKGYQPMIYFNWHQSENLYYLSELEDYPFWLALYQDRMTYPWQIEMWQYTATGSVPGIQGDVDLNVYMPW